jgi:hypothetical protein
MKSPLLSRVSFAVAFLAAGALVSLDVAAAETTGAAGATMAAKEVARSSSAVVAKPLAVKPVAKAGAALNSAGDNQFPSGAPIVPPKPKKDGPEAAAAAAIKAKANAATP